MINANQLTDLVITPAIRKINDYSDGCKLLLSCTVAQESLGGYYLKQTNGPAIGIYQMEPKTHDWLWQSYLDRTVLGTNIMMACGTLKAPSSDRMVYDLSYATIMAYALYSNRRADFKSCNTIESCWPVYKSLWNTKDGKATEDEFINNCHKFLGNK